MYVLIVGGGKVGFHLARTLLSAGHEVTVIERLPARAATLRRQLGAANAVLQADGTLPSVLDGAGCARADAVVAVTGDDAANLLISVLAARHFAAGRTIARLNDPRNEPLFQRARVGAMVSASAILADLVEREVAAPRVRTLLPLPGGRVALVQVDLGVSSTAVGAQVRQVRWPDATLLVLVLHGDTPVVPTGATVLAAGDRLLLVAPPEAEAPLQALLAPGDTA